MLGANLIGFQSTSYLQHFLSSCTRILGYTSTPDGVKTYGSHCAVGVFPIGIDVAKLESSASHPGIEEKMKAIKEMYAGKKIIVGRDRLDSVRGVMQKLRAFEAFLEMYEEWRERVSLHFLPLIVISLIASFLIGVSIRIMPECGTKLPMYLHNDERLQSLRLQCEKADLVNIPDLGRINSSHFTSNF